MPLRVVRRVVVATIAVVALCGWAAEIAYHTIGADDDLVALLSLSEEANLPTWLASALLLATALVLAGVASQAPEGMPRRWWFLAGGFALMSVDEVATLHERLNDLVPFSGTLRFDWIIPAAIFVVLVGFAYLPFLARLPRWARNRFVLAGALYLVGAVVMEVPLGWWAEHHGEGLGYFLIDAVEETLELCGAGVFLLAVVRLAAERRVTLLGGAP